ncbi:MAG TPA: PQQ-binding-like beta-propeller repeat protein [Planctomycetaceae bacterium]|nr:PQQ-binding-like beta-propeller repeat protein [Planctomycetaceae bacterium]
MSTEHSNAPASSPEKGPVAPTPPARLGGALWILGVYWGATLGLMLVEVPYFARFIYGMAAPAFLLIAFTIWWWMRYRIAFRDRTWGFLAVLAGAAIAASLAHRTVGWAGTLMTGLPIVLTAWMLWWSFAQRSAQMWTRLASLAVLAVAWGWLGFVRIEGLDGDLHGDMHWRWTPTAEQDFLAAKESAAGAMALGAVEAPVPVTLAPGDWPEFRGPKRDGVVHGTMIATDWNAAPPRPLWRQRVGPAWSSVIVIGARLYTQEQRGDAEAVVCYDATTGHELWAHTDIARFEESVSGAGPRATPTFADGRIYSLGGTGMLNCLDAATGKPHWSHNLAIYASTKPPLWGLSGSPLVVNGKLIIYGGGASQKNLLAFDAATGELAWGAVVGDQSYSSPEAVTIGGVTNVLMLNDQGLSAIDPETGNAYWQTGLAMPGAPRPLQAHLVGTNRLLIGSLQGFSTTLLEISPHERGWSISDVWTSSQVKPEFSDFVVLDGFAFGFDGAIFCCIDLATGQRVWKAGRYGRGQVIALADQQLLVVVSEGGEAILVKGSSNKHEELGRFQAVNGKTWNHPVIVLGRLFVRNAEEMACYDMAEKR